MGWCCCAHAADLTSHDQWHGVVVDRPVTWQVERCAALKASGVELSMTDGASEQDLLILKAILLQVPRALALPRSPAPRARKS